MRAVGRNIEKPNWKYQLKLLVEPFDSNSQRNCGDRGIFQTFLQSEPQSSQYPNMYMGGKFDVAFQLNPESPLTAIGAASAVGPAHFCVLNAWNKEGNDVASTVSIPGTPVTPWTWLGANVLYIFQPFTVV